LIWNFTCLGSVKCVHLYFYKDRLKDNEVFGKLWQINWAESNLEIAIPNRHYLGSWSTSNFNIRSTFPWVSNRCTNAN
jgi:hypothetical protein